MLPALAAAQGVPRGEAARGVTVADRAREDFDPLGVRLDGFRVDAAAELGLGYDDNLFGTRRNREGDFFATLGAEASARSDWTTHALGLTGRVEQRRYIDNGRQDWTDYAIGAFGRYDITPDTNVQLILNRVQEHLEVDSVDLQQGNITRPVPYTYNEAQLQGQTRFNRLGVLLLGNWRGYSFDDVDLGPATAPGAPRPGEISRFDFDSASAALGLSYELSPGRNVTLITRYQDITYDNTAQRARDSQTWEVLAGFTYDFDGIWAFRGAIGYRERDYEGAGLPNLSGPAFEGEVTYQPTQLTTLSAGFRRTIEESIRNDAVAYTRTRGQVRVDHEYLRNVILSAEVGANRREYEEPDEQSTDGYALLQARWLINRNLALVGSYQHTRRLDSSAGIDEYDRNLVLLRLRIAL
ncbi:outer membrane beta-barrel protein [Falsiroseomonas sp.]|uniref:outer membrane beta-barrel protein n=1 Tax=Falsiroseomonas sp. TaxID=2870721 RepID=UPI003567DEC1